MTDTLTKRDWFAGQIAAGMAAHSGTSGVSFGPGQIAGRAYEVAEALLAELARTEPKAETPAPKADDTNGLWTLL